MLGLDFVNDVEHNEELMSSEWDILPVSGLDPDANKRLEGPSTEVVPLGSEAKTGTIQRVGGLVPGVTYRVRAVVITTLGNTRNLWSHIRGVRANT